MRAGAGASRLVSGMRLLGLRIGKESGGSGPAEDPCTVRHPEFAIQRRESILHGASDLVEFGCDLRNGETASQEIDEPGLSGVELLLIIAAASASSIPSRSILTTLPASHSPAMRSTGERTDSAAMTSLILRASVSWASTARE